MRIDPEPTLNRTLAPAEGAQGSRPLESGQSPMVSERSGDDD